MVDIKSTISNARELDSKLTEAENKVNKMKSTLGIEVED